MSIIEAIILGLAQGLTEFIPVSSSGHLLLLHEMLGTNENSLGFDVVLHVGTLLALIVFFKQDITMLIKNVSQKNSEGRLARILAVATLPAALVGLLFSDFIDDTVRSPFVVMIALAIVGGIMLIVDSLKPKTKNIEEVSMKQGILIGVAQMFALIPGVSRSGATITTGLMLGLSRELAARFSFLLAIPIITGSALGLLIKGDLGASDQTLPLLLGMCAAFLSGLFAIKFMLNIIGKVGLRPFALYRIALAVVVGLFLL